MNEFRSILERGLNLVAADKLDEALLELTSGAHEAVKQDELQWAALLAKNAGLLCQEHERIEEALDSYKLALQCNERDPYLHYCLGVLYERLGQRNAAESHIKDSYRIAAEQQDGDLLQVLSERISNEPH